MTWWGTDLSRGSYQPKQKNRFAVELINGGMLLSISSITKPSVTIESKQYQMINHYYNYPGIAKWEPITMKFVDGAGWGNQTDSIKVAGQDISLEAPPNSRMTSAALWEMLLASGYTPPSGETGFSSREKSISSPEKASTMDLSFGGNIVIHQLTPEGVNKNGILRSVETWTLHNPIITKISWGDLDYGDDGLVEYTLDITYDWAVHTGHNPNDTELSDSIQPGLNASISPMSDFLKRSIRSSSIKSSLQNNPGNQTFGQSTGGFGDFNPSSGGTIG